MARLYTSIALLFCMSCVYHNEDAGPELAPASFSVTPKRLIEGSVVQLSLSVTTRDGKAAQGLTMRAVVDNAIVAAQTTSNTTAANGTWSATLPNLADGNHFVNAQLMLQAGAFFVSDGVMVQVLAAVNQLNPSTATQPVQSGNTQTLGVDVVDAFGNPLANDVVAFSATPAGITFATAQATTDAQGHASVTGYSNIAGTYTITMSDASGAIATTTLTIRPGPPDVGRPVFSAEPSTPPPARLPRSRCG